MKTHYDVLNLQKSCSSKEIKEAFIKLSKKYHPDKNKNTDAHKKFVEINEAYTVLGKSDTRWRYDQTLSYGGTRSPQGFSRSPTVIVRTPYEHYANMYAENMRRNTDTRGRQSANHLKALIFCCLLLFIGSGIQLRAQILKRNSHSQTIAEQSRRLELEKKRKEFEAAMLKHKLENADMQK